MGLTSPDVLARSHHQGLPLVSGPWFKLGLVQGCPEAFAGRQAPSWLCPHMHLLTGSSTAGHSGVGWKGVSSRCSSSKSAGGHGRTCLWAAGTTPGLYGAILTFFSVIHHFLSSLPAFFLDHTCLGVCSYSTQLLV